MNYPSRPSRSWTVLQATQQSPTLARLAELAADSTARLHCIAPLLPAALRKSVKGGAVDDTVWCLVVDNNAVASKVRQLLPALMAQLRTKGWDVAEIRIKVSREI
jgi:hypothetical protein